MGLYRLDKAVLSIKNNPARFLNGITSNILTAPQNAFLTVHGRIVATFEQTMINEEEAWIVVGAGFVDQLLVHIDKYAKLSVVKIEKLDTNVYCDTDLKEDIGEKETVTIPFKSGRLLLSDKAHEANEPDDAFTLWRLKNHVPLQGIDFNDEFVLNVSPVDYVSFTKGCFLGQEPISKVHNRSRPTWELVVKYEHDCEEETKVRMTSKTLDPETKKALGFTFVKT